MVLAKVKPDPRIVNDRPGIILVAVFAIIPLAIAPSIFLESSLTPKLAVAFLGVVCLLVCTEYWWPGVQVLAGTTSGRLYLGLLVAQVLSLSLSTAFSADSSLASFGTTGRRFGAISQVLILFLTLVAASYSSIRREVVPKILLAVELAGGLAATYGILQYFGLDPLLPAQTYNNTYNALRIPATFGHAMVFANFLLPVVLIAGSSLLTESRAAWQWLHGVVLSAALAAIILAGTRSALLGLGFGALLLIYFRGKNLTKKKALVLVTGSAAFLLLIVVFAQSPAGQKFRIRIAQWSEDRKGGPRLLVWRDSLPLIRSNWVIGIGPEGFGGEFRKLESPELARAYPDTYHESPHNLFLEVAVNQGLIGLLLLICLFSLALFYGFWQARDGNADSRILVACLLGSFVSLQFAPLAFVNVLCLYLFAGLLLASNTSQRSQRKIAAIRPLVRVSLKTSAVLVAAVGSVYVIQDFYFASTARRLAEGDLDGAVESYGIARAFPLPGEELWCSRQLAILARSSQGGRRNSLLMAAKRASADAERGTEENFYAYYQSGILATVSGDFGEAETKLRQSIALAPSWYRPHAMLASVLMEQGRTEPSEQEAKLALEYAGSHQDEIRLALRKINEQPIAKDPRTQ
jgi:O-antigen ligase